ncbi:tetratricopeptide repeat protein [Curtobacterium sp. NPDC087082]|uniref:tetratricopeptide repeat protein n=1 Tax=Curtobacterium sp. NPDC087082 TaxID=3363966 RepID=UPI00380D4A83
MTGGTAERGAGPTVQRAAALIDAGRPADALADLAVVERDQGASVAGHRVRALALLALDRPDDAQDEARRAVGLAPTDSVALRILSTTLVRSGDQTGAVAAARRSVEADPGSWLAHLAVADALWLDERRRPEALRASYETVRLAPLEPMAHRRHGDLLLAAGRQRDAQAAYRRGLELAPEDRGARHNFAVSRLRRGHDGESALAFAGILATDPTNALARRNLVVGVLNPLARIRFGLGAGALMTGFQCLVSLDAPSDADRWYTTLPPVIGLALVVVVVLRFAAETRPRTGFLVRAARRAVPGWTTTVAVLGAATAVSVAGLFLPPDAAVVAQGLVFAGVVVASVRIRSTMRAFPKTTPVRQDVDEGRTDRDDDGWGNPW